MTNATTTPAYHFGFDGFARTEGDALPSLLTTEQVCEFFAGRAANIEPGFAEAHPTWAPAARESFARCAIDGDVEGRRVAVTEDLHWDSNDYDWFNLGDLGEDEIVWRVSCNGTLYVFRRVAEDDGWLGRRVENCDLDEAAAATGLNRNDSADFIRAAAWLISDGKSVGVAVATALTAVAGR